MKANHNYVAFTTMKIQTVSKIVKSQNESKSQQNAAFEALEQNCVKDR